LTELGAPFIVFLTDRVMDGTDQFRLEISRSGDVTASYRDRVISPHVVAAGWYWKLTSFRVRGAESNVSMQMTMVNEVTALHNAVWSLYPESIWLTSPTDLWRAERKLVQLTTARSVGFTIPQTAVGSDWSHIEEMLTDGASGLIVKMARGVLADQNTVKAMQTTRLDRVAIDDLAARTVPFPGIYQPFIPKEREWRVSVVGPDVFSAAIYTDGPATVDWRQHQMTDAVRFVREELQPSVAERCITFLSDMNLGYGAFDLIETPDGEIVFLECNPSGQFSWLEDRLGLPISAAFAAALVRRRATVD
jgi:hypothetical protein